MTQVMRPQERAARSRRKAGSGSGWVPNQHGAWAFVITPWILGVAWAVGAHQMGLAQVVLFAFWMVGYFAFFASSLWLKSRFKPRYRDAMVTYSAIAVVLGLGVLLVAPHWWSWVIAYLPLCSLALWYTYRRRERELFSNLLTIVAACLIPLVMGSGGLFSPGGMPQLGVVALVCFGYFFGTVLYVKTVLRERGKVSYVIASIGWHLLCALISLSAPAPFVAPLLAAFFLLMALRAGLTAILGPMRGRRVSAKTIGVAEFGWTILLLVVMVPPLLA